jgi:hypothetical protein
VRSGRRGDGATDWQQQKPEQFDKEDIGGFVSIGAANQGSRVRIGCAGLIDMFGTGNMKEIGPDVTLRQPIDEIL